MKSLLRIASRLVRFERLSVSARKAGFTLVELLVVISIIGMLSSVILASLQGAREKGRVGAGIKFATYNYRAFGADSDVLYRFNEPSGSSLTDDSGNNRTGTITGTDYSRVTSYDSINSNTALSLNASTETTYVTIVCGTCDKVLDSTSFTVSFWIKHGLISQLTDYIFYAGQPASSFIIQALQNGKISIITGATNAGSATVATNDNKWHHIAVQWKSGTGLIYIDGRIGSAPLSGTNPVSAAPFYIGGGSGNYFTGTLDDFVIYSSSLSSKEIEKIYAEGASKHGLAVAD